VDERWTVAEIAERLSIEPSTWRAYVARKQAPEPDGHYDSRTPWWFARTIREWNRDRSGPTSLRRI
jgi:hypothetical protein